MTGMNFQKHYFLEITLPPCGHKFEVPADDGTWASDSQRDFPRCPEEGCGAIPSGVTMQLIVKVTMTLV
jgi:hypothetical protein